MTEKKDTRRWPKGSAVATWGTDVVEVMEPDPVDGWRVRVRATRLDGAAWWSVPAAILLARTPLARELLRLAQ